MLLALTPITDILCPIWVEIGSFSIFLVILKVSFILATVGPLCSTHSVLDIIEPLALNYHTINVIVFGWSMYHIVLKEAINFAAICPVKGAFAMHLIGDPLAFVKCVVFCIGKFAKSMSIARHPLAIVLWTIGVLHDTLALHNVCLDNPFTRVYHIFIFELSRCSLFQLNIWFDS